MLETQKRPYKSFWKRPTPHEPIQIISDASNGILISEEDWQAMQETLYLLSISGMRESIRDGMATPIEECSKELRW